MMKRMIPLLVALAIVACEPGVVIPSDGGMGGSVECTPVICMATPPNEPKHGDPCATDADCAQTGPCMTWHCEQTGACYVRTAKVGESCGDGYVCRYPEGCCTP